MNCPLCQNDKTSFFFEDKRRSYFQCQTCCLIFVPSKYWLSEEEEKKEYDLHQNSPTDDGYVKFLSRLTIPLLKIVEKNSSGLDFGSGPGPTLSLLLEREGHKVNLFDKFYANDRAVLNTKYHFITATEVFEHLKRPELELTLLVSLLLEKGVLGIMTKLAKDKQAFSNWHYKNDPTHICFYSEKTFLWIAASMDLNIEFIGGDVVFLSRKNE
ncbi:MAG: class I SAM-dependent methyltransferase [Halobacteriovoraceae bacterium]|jgi:hypothetical protein|nr:class I SAM-dependent methyltransferase [Halobacteriovoraceae bacterium]